MPTDRTRRQDWRALRTLAQRHGGSDSRVGTAGDPQCRADVTVHCRESGPYTTPRVRTTVPPVQVPQARSLAVESISRHRSCFEKCAVYRCASGRLRILPGRYAAKLTPSSERAVHWDVVILAAPLGVESITWLKVC